ncbi:MAG: MFS transporter, partial [Alphaproteobacteria bacterium]
AAAILTGLAATPLALAAGLTLIGVFASIYHPVGIAWLVRVAVNRGRALGINGVFGNLGTAGAALVAGLLTEAISWRAAFVVPGLVCVATGIAFAFAVRTGRIVAQRADRRPEPPASRGDMVRVFWVLSLTMLVTGVVWQVVQWSLPKLFEERVVGPGAGVALTGGMVSLVFLFAIGSQLLGGWAADRFDLRRVYLVAFWIQAPLLLGLALAVGAAILPVAVALVFVNTGNTPAENALLARYAPARWRATAFGAKFVLALGVAAGSTALVAMVHRWTGSFSLLFAGLAVLALGAALAAHRLPARQAAAALPVAAE